MESGSESKMNRLEGLMKLANEAVELIKEFRKEAEILGLNPLRAISIKNHGEIIEVDDEFEGIKLSNLAIVPVQIKGDKFLQINISVKNTNSYAKEISLATCSDIQVADDDNATTFFNGNGFTMTNMYCETSDNYPFGTIPTATLNVYAKDVP